MEWRRWVKAGLSLPVINPALVRVARRLPITPTVARLPVSVPKVEGIVGDVQFSLVEPDRCTIAKELFWGRGERVKLSERTALRLFGDLAKRANHVLDIGANTGLFSVVAARANPSCTVEAFEIVPDVFEILVRNLFHNDVASQVTARFAGVGRAGFRMRVPSFRRASSLPTSVSARDGYREGVEVTFVSLDQLLESAKAGFILTKIDVEGTEDELLVHGARGLESREAALLCELLPTARMEVIRPILEHAGFDAFLIRDGFLERRRRVEPSADHHDWLLVRGVARLEDWTSIPIRHRASD